MEVRELETEAERREAVPILRQLWDQTAPEDAFEWTGDDDYYLFGGFLDDDLVAVAGVLERRVLHHSRHAWIYDLVVDEPSRGAGHGTAVVEHIEAWADERGCEYVTLASPLEKEGTHRFYETQGYEKWEYVIEKEL